MIDDTEIVLCEPAPFLYHENGQIAVTDGSSVWLLIVTCEAMKATTHPPEKSLRRLLFFVEYYRDLAAAAIRNGEDIDGKVWVTQATVLSCPPAQAFRQSDHVAAHTQPNSLRTAIRNPW